MTELCSVYNNLTPHLHYLVFQCSVAFLKLCKEYLNGGLYYSHFSSKVEHFDKPSYDIIYKSYKLLKWSGFWSTLYIEHSAFGQMKLAEELKSYITTLT